MGTLTISNFNVNYFFIPYLCCTLAPSGSFWKVGNFTDVKMETTSVRNEHRFSCRVAQHTRVSGVSHLSLLYLLHISSYLLPSLACFSSAGGVQCCTQKINAKGHKKKGLSLFTVVGWFFNFLGFHISVFPILSFSSLTPTCT